MSDLTPIIKESFIQYSGAVLQSRALVDVRDCLKPSARQVFYCMYTDKFLSSKPYKKTLKAVGSAMRVYIHGDSSCEGIIMRAGQPFAMRYPLVDVDGSYGNLIESGNWAASRYTSSRLSEISNYLFSDIDKDTIKDWRDNYDDTEQYPAVLPSKGFYNIVNGTLGIGIGAASSVPQFNLKDVNNALIKVLWNPAVDFEEVYCTPDFATGALLLNEKEVKESLRNGQGKACKLRSVIEFDSKERVLIVKEIPYGVYTNTICGELEAILNGEDNPGIDRFNDLTAATPNIKIYLTKSANVNKVLKYLYKNTSLQYYYGINLTMLDDGRFPKVFTWNEILQSFINHQIIVYTRGFEFDLAKVRKRLHIVEGLLIALASIEEVVQTIKSSSSTAEANTNLQKNFLLDEAQAKAILDMKLSKLAHLEVDKLEKEKVELLREEARICEILESETLLKKEIEKDLINVANKFGDDRRTQVLNTETEDSEPVEIKNLQVSLTNKNNIFVNETSSLYTQRRGGVGNKLKLESGEYVISTSTVKTVDKLLFFTTEGIYYNCPVNILNLNEKISLYSILSLTEKDSVCAMAAVNERQKEDQYILFITKNGMLKKSLLSEYNTNRSVGIKAITLGENDKIVKVIFSNSDKIGVLSKNGNFLITTVSDVNAIGRVAKGIKLIKLNDGDYVVSAEIIPTNTTEILSISKNGYSKKTSLNEFTPQGKNTKGTKLQKFNDNDCAAAFVPFERDAELLIAATNSCIKIKTTEIPTQTKGTIGIKTIKLSDKNSIIGIQMI